MAKDAASHQRPAQPDPVTAAGAGAWRWDPAARRLHLHGALEALGLEGFARDGRLDALLVLAAPAHRRRLEDAFGEDAPAGDVAFELVLRSGARGLWRGRRARDGGGAIGLVLPAPEARAGSPQADPLTGLLTRPALVRGLAARLEAGEALRLLTADVVRFNRLNEGLGPALADDVLAALGSRLAGAYAAEALPARIGEDEFAVVAAAGAVGAADALRADLEAPLRLGGFDIHPKVAIGEAVSQVGDDAVELLRRVGAARLGEAASPLEASGARSRLELESDMRGAVRRGELEPFYQPVVRLHDARITGFEALVRWRHPRLGLLHPDEFLPLVGEAGLMGELTLHMIEAAADQVARWRRDHPDAGALSVGVNLTSADLDRPDLVERVGAIIAGRGLPQGALKLELTESEIMRDPDGAADVLGRLREAGAALAVDDFGMGFSSLSYLARLPLQQLKIDRYFVRTMGVNEGSAKIVRSVIALGRDLGLEIIAEGVEDAPMAAELSALGCHYGQGFGYARPLPAMEAEVYLNESYLDGAPLRESAAPG
ncbi:MAG: EAL domain-containing protein [Caulobacteraceae bacterium]|nr:EAL domain-containing protein [Caulobacter sp.]